MLDYSAINPDSVKRTADNAIARAQDLKAVVADPQNPLLFSTVLAPFDEIKNIIRTAQGASGFLRHVHENPEVRLAAAEANERMESWHQFPETPQSLEMASDPAVYETVTRYADTQEAGALKGEKARLLSFVRRDLHMMGHHLSPTDRDRLKVISDRLVSLGTEFATNIAEYQDFLLIGDDDTDGLPASFVESLEVDEETGKRKVTMAYPHVVPFGENSSRRDLREELTFKFNNRAVDTNRQILEQAVALRLEAARLLGFESWAERVLSTRMARTKDRVDEMYAGIIPILSNKADSEIEKVSGLLRDDTGDALVQVWDWNYYTNQIRKSEYGVDPTEVANYFPMDAVLGGMFEITSEVFGLTYRQVEEPVWHEDVQVYEVDDTATGELIGTFRLDLHPRDGKFTHAAVFPGTPGKLLADGSYQKPTCSMLCNFTKPTENAPSLLKHREVETLFHEFGHVLHVLLGQSELAYFSDGTEWDFVEAPSQIMQHWIWQPDVLQRFARHYESGEVIPTELVESLVAARRLNGAMFQLRQAQFGILDQMLHGPEDNKDLDEILREATKISKLPFQEGTFMPAAFGHMFGYDAGYYGYMWSEVFGDDMFSRFEEEGILNPEVGRDYRNEVIGRGSTIDADDMLVNFLGRESNNQAFLRKLGIQ